MHEFAQFAESIRHAAPGLDAALTREDEDHAPDMDMPTIWFGAVGRILATAGAGRLPAEERAAAYAVVEHHLTTGTQKMRDCIATGLLEAVVNQVSRDNTVDTIVDTTELAARLGPHSRAYIDAWDQFTLGRPSLPEAERPTDVPHGDLRRP